MLSLEFEKNGEIIALSENDLFDFRFERGCFSGNSFELGGVNSNLVYCVIDNNSGRFPRGSFASSRLTLYIDGVFCGKFNTELPKRRNGVIEITAYDDMLKLDCEFPDSYGFPQTFWSVYAECVYEAGLASDISFDNYVLNSLFNNGVISHEYTEYIYANSCRNLVSGMAEWNGGFAYINDDGKLQVDVFSKDVKKTLRSGELMAFDYSDETVTFSRIRTSQKNKTYEMGDDTGYTLVIRNQYIGYGLEDKDFETYFRILYDYYKGFSLTPMTFTLAEPDFELKIGDRISVVDEEENVTVTGNISKIVVRGNCSMEITCGGFGNIGSVSNYKPTSQSQTAMAKTEAKIMGMATNPNLTEYEYLTDLSVKYNGITYTVEKDTETGLISRISDSSGKEFSPKINGNITDTAMHNAVFWAVAMHSGFGQVAEKPLYTGENNAAKFSGGLTGFQIMADAKQNKSGVYLSAYSSGIVAIRLEKAYGPNIADDNYTDAVVIRSNEQINLTGYSKMRIMAVAFRNKSRLTGKVYFLAGEPPAAHPNCNYNFSNWQHVGNCDIVATDYYNAPGSPKTYDIDISTLSGNQYLNFGVYHSNEVNEFSVYFDIHKITLIP